MHEAVGAVHLLGPIGGFEDPVGIENVAIAGFQSKFESRVRGLFKHSEN